MGTIWVREFVGGLDTRRMPETTSGGVLIKATDVHINRGGEIEKRAAFVKQYPLPVGDTVGLAAGKTSLVVFGHEAPPSVPVGISYQRLQHPDGVTALVGVPSYDLYGGKIYAVGEFADGSRYHFYDGVRVPDWFDGRARASFRVVSGAGTPATAATGSFEVTGGTSNPGVNRFSNITIDGVAIISAPVDHTGNNSTTASAIASAINSHTSSPDYTASASGQTVTITAAATGVAANGKTIVVTGAGNATSGNIQNMAGGAVAVSAQLTNITVDGVAVIASPVTWDTSNSNTAELIADAINSTSSTPEYSATAVGEVVNIIADAAGVNANGRVISFTSVGGFTVDPETGLVMADGADPSPATSATGSFNITGGTSSPGVNRITDIQINGVSLIGGTPINWATSNAATAATVASAINSYVSSPDYTAVNVPGETLVTITASATGPTVNGKSIDITVGGDVSVGSVQAMSGGADAEATYVPGNFVKTIGSRMHSVSGPNEHFSGIKAPTKWTTDTTGAGFIDMSTQESGSETLTALARYQQFIAVFAATVIQIWYFDSDPALNAQKQVLNNTGTECPRSVTQFGDNDLFYVHESGVRSLRARDASNAAATTDIGVPVDSLVVQKLRSLTPEQRTKVFGLIEPKNGRFWVFMIDTIFVFSFFQGAKISAWTTYTPSTTLNGERVDFNVDEAVVFDRQVFVRSGDDIYVYGGVGTEETYDETEAEVWLPYLDADKPNVPKRLQSLDIAAEGDWSVRVAMEPTNLEASDLVCNIAETSYGIEAIGAIGQFTHISLRFKTTGDGPAKLGSVVINHDLED